MLLAEPPRSLPPLSQITKVEGIQNSRSPFCLLYTTASLGCWMTWRECTVNGCGREKAGSKRGNQLSGREELGQSCPGGTSHLSSDYWKERTWSLELKNSASSLPTRCALVYHYTFWCAWIGENYCNAQNCLSQVWIRLQVKSQSVWFNKGLISRERSGCRKAKAWVKGMSNPWIGMMGKWGFVFGMAFWDGSVHDG